MFAVLFLTALAAALMLRLRVFRPNSVVGPERGPDRGGLWPLMVVAIIGFLTWQFGLAIYLAARQSELRKSGVADVERALPGLLTPRDYALMSTIPPAVAVAAMVAALTLVFPGSVSWIGLDWRRLPRGLWAGVVAFLVIGPVVFWASAALFLLYQKFRYQHPSEHELLKKLGETHSPIPAALLVVGATVMAPLLEELLFRGLLQTFLRQGLMRMWLPIRPVGREVSAEATHEPSAEGLPPEMPVEHQAAIPANVQPLHLPLVPQPWHGWVAILITSLAFAMLHEAWMRPVIFVLSIGLGYVYERTGILWSSITVHFLFNAFQTMQFLVLINGN